MSEFIGPSVEIVRGKGVKPDVLFSKTATRQDLVSDLRDLLVGEIPNAWRPRMSSFVLQDASLLHYLDNPNEPQYYAKVRAGLTRYDSVVPKSSFFRRIFNADLSLVNEISLAPAVTAVVESESVQSAVRQYGFDRLEFIEPLVGIIEKGYSPRKIMIYEYREMFPPTLKQLEELRSFEHYLIFKFEGLGIDPMDLRAGQMMASPTTSDGQRTLYLLDSERYVRM
ncbi:MAG: hypothetical protein AAB532_04060 [Patescibacteria group bacterium]